MVFCSPWLPHCIALSLLMLHLKSDKLLDLGKVVDGNEFYS